MELFIDLSRVEDRDGIWLEVEVEAIPDLVCTPTALKLEVGNLAKRMDARIGTAGSVKRGAFTRQFLNGIGQGLLHRGAVVLHLPADERPAIILNGYTVARHPAR